MWEYGEKVHGGEDGGILPVHGVEGVGWRVGG